MRHLDEDINGRRRKPEEKSRQEIELNEERARAKELSAWQTLMPAWSLP
jgi:hypothetical protein